MAGSDWRRFVAPAAFLLAATVAVVLVHSGMDAGGKTAGASTVPVPPHRQVSSTTTATRTKHRAHTSTQATSTAAGTQYWTVQAGDTYGVISSKSGVPVATLEQLNPGISSTSLTIGERVRLR